MKRAVGKSLQQRWSWEKEGFCFDLEPMVNLNWRKMRCFAVVGRLKIEDLRG